MLTIQIPQKSIKYKVLLLLSISVILPKGSYCQQLLLHPFKSSACKYQIKIYTYLLLYTKGSYTSLYLVLHISTYGSNSFLKTTT